MNRFSMKYKVFVLPVLTLFSVLLMPAHAADRALQFGDVAVTESPAKYGRFSYSFDFTVTKNNASLSPKKNPKAKLNCSDDGAQFYIRHSALPFMKVGSGSYFVVRGPYGVAGIQNEDFCKSLAAVWQGSGTPVTLRLHTLPEHWSLNEKKKQFEAQGGSNNLFLEKYEAITPQ